MISMISMPHPEEAIATGKGGYAIALTWGVLHRSYPNVTRGIAAKFPASTLTPDKIQ
jgi:hypothetical protein